MPKDQLPDRRPPRAHQQAMLEVFRYELARYVVSQKDQIDTLALGDALRCAYNEEVAFLEDGLDRANGSQAKLEILVAKVAMFSRKNNARIERRF